MALSKFDYSRTDTDGLGDHLRHVPWDDIFKLGVSIAAAEFRDWVPGWNYVYIPHRKHHVKLSSSPLISAACAAVIGHRNHYFACKKRTNLLHLKRSSDRQNCLKRVVKTTTLDYTNKTKVFRFSKT